MHTQPQLMEEKGGLKVPEDKKLEKESWLVVGEN